MIFGEHISTRINTILNISIFEKQSRRKSSINHKSLNLNNNKKLLSEMVLRDASEIYLRQGFMNFNFILSFKAQSKIQLRHSNGRLKENIHSDGFS